MLREYISKETMYLKRVRIERKIHAKRERTRRENVREERTYAKREHTLREKIY